MPSSGSAGSPITFGAYGREPHRSSAGRICSQPGPPLLARFPARIDPAHLGGNSRGRAKRRFSIRWNRRRGGRIAGNALKIIELYVLVRPTKVAADLPGHRQHPVLRGLPGRFRPDNVLNKLPRKMLKLATKKGFLRQNSGGFANGRQRRHERRAGCACVSFSSASFAGTERAAGVKGGGCENVGAQYSLPDRKLQANRDLDGAARRFSTRCCRRRARATYRGFSACALAATARRV